MLFKKRLMLLASTALFTFSLSAAEGDSAKIKNPMLWADVPDPDVIRVGDDYYLAGTTMHTVPGLVILHSKDLRPWEP